MKNNLLDSATWFYNGPNDLCPAGQTTTTTRLAHYAWGCRKVRGAGLIIFRPRWKVQSRDLAVNLSTPQFTLNAILRSNCPFCRAQKSFSPSFFFSFFLAIRYFMSASTSSALKIASGTGLTDEVAAILSGPRESWAEQLDEALLEAIAGSHRPTVKVLLDGGAKLKFGSYAILLNRKNVGVFQELLDHGFDINTREFGGEPPLR